MKLCVSLDLKSKKENLKLANELKEHNIWLKVGFKSFINSGKKLLHELKDINPDFKIFLDLKLYDIPNTMAEAAKEICKLPVEMFNVHASSGFEAMDLVKRSVQAQKSQPLIMAVTALTSFDNTSFRAIYNQDLAIQTRHFAKLAFDARLDGVVCSAFESFDIKEHTANTFLSLCPGIRPFNEDRGDQRRVADLKLAKKEEVDFIVVGRPIYENKNPKEVLEKILAFI